MHKSRMQYVLTWVSLLVFIICSTFLLTLAWNSRILESISPALLSLFWIGNATAGIYLFMLAVKMAHRKWIDEKRDQDKEAKIVERPSKGANSSSENKALDYASAARKIVRRVPENVAQEQLGKLLLKNLARELEIMSGVYYIEKRGKYTVQASYAMTSSTEDFSFKSGEGLPGQVAKNQQIMVLNQLPEGYLEVFSGLGKAPPSYLAIIPLVHKGKTRAVLECSGYRYVAGDIENMFRIFARDLMGKLSPNLS